MPQKKVPTTEASANLRSRAESKREEKFSSLDDMSSMSPEQLQILLHELQIHQIELELQNQELRETQQELSKSRDDFVDLYDFSPVGYLTINDKGMIVQANLTAAKMLGVYRGTLLKKPLSIFIAPDDRDKYCINKTKPSQIISELHLVRADTTSFEVELTVAPILDMDGNFQHHFKVIISDMTELGEARKKLRQSEATFRSIFDNSVVGIILELPDGTVLKANASACVSLGRSEEELRKVGRIGFLDLNDPRIPKHLERIMREGKSSAEVNYVKKDGTVFPVECATASFTDYDGSKKIIESFRDISLRKEAEKRLSESEKRFRELVELLPQGIFEADSEANITFTNSTLKQVIGACQDEDIIGTSFPGLADPDEHKNLIDYIKAAQKGLFYEQEFMGHERKGKTGREFLVKVGPIRSNDSLVGFRGVVTDISLLKQAERERKDMQEHLFQSQKLASLGTLAGGIAHDFNNMLQVIIGYGEILMDYMEQGRPDVKCLSNILETSHEAAALVRKFMAIGRQSMVSPRPIDPNDKIREMEFLILRLPNIDGLSLDLVDEPTIVMQDPEQLDQVIMILATNASDAMSNTGELRFSTSRVILDDDASERRIGVNSGPYVLLTITDTGRGMDGETLKRIFDPFFSTKPRGNIKGMGLGLSVLRGIVEQQGGFVTCESELGKGTTFRVYFPEIEGPAASSILASNTGRPGCGKTVLVVEDNALVATLEETAFNEAGYPTIVASNGREAVNIYKEKHGDIGLVIIDIIMPMMSGRDCLRELLKINPRVKVIVLSGHDPKSEQGLEVKPYIQGYLLKPCKMNQLLKMAQLVMEG
ncbi:MAG: PAS domain S-box protein [Desulfomonilaceae bacterium]